MKNGALSSYFPDFSFEKRFNDEYDFRHKKKLLILSQSEENYPSTLERFVDMFTKMLIPFHRFVCLEDKKPRDASDDVAEKSSTTEASSDEASKAVTPVTATDGTEKEVTAETTNAAKKMISETATDKAAKEIIPMAVPEGAVKNVSAKAAEKKVTAKKFTISLERIELRTPVKVDTDVEVVTSKAGFVENKPVISKSCFLLIQRTIV